MTSAALGAGNVEIALDGETVVLKPTLRAAQTISRQAGGIMGAVNAVGRFELDVIANVIALGLNKTKPGEINDIAEQVYEAGLVNLVEPVTSYLTILANGGRPVASSGGEGGTDPRSE